MQEKTQKQPKHTPAEMVSGGIFGPKLSGKTTLARALSKQYWLKKKMRSLILDPHLEEWGDQAWVTDNEEKFWKAVWETKNSLIIVEEAAATIRRERNLVPVFTRLRHYGHILVVIGHSGMDLLPVMRQQFDTIYLFRQPRQAAEVWAMTFAEERLLEAMQLSQYEFIHSQLFRDPKRLKLSL